MSSSRSTSDRFLVAASGASLLVLPLLASSPEAWSAMVAVAFASTLALIVLWKRDPLTTKQVVWGTLLLRVAFLPLLPGLTDDLYRYIWDGWLQVKGINPYRYAPENEALAPFQTAPLYERLNSQPYYSVYPPLTQVVFAFGGLFYSLDWKASYYVLKGIFTAAEFGGVLFLSKLTSARNLLLYAWNPLVLLEIAGQGHTEALLIPLIIGAVVAVCRNSPRWASLAIAGAGLVKLYPFVMWPFLLRRYGWTAVWPGVLLIVGVSFPYAAPYALPHLKESVDLFAHLMEFNAGLYYLVKYVAWLITGADWSKVIGPTFRYIFLASLPGLYYLDYRRDWSFRWVCLLTIGLFLIFSTTVHPWYLVPLLAVGVIHARPAWPWFWIGAFSIGTYLFYVGGPYWTWIILGWGGGAVLLGWCYRQTWVDVATNARHFLSWEARRLRRVYSDS